MTERAPTIEALVRGPSLFRGGVALYGDLLVGDPVGLFRETDNPVDPNAVMCTSMEESPFGYIQREKAGVLSEWMDKGWVYTAKVIVPAKIRKAPRGKLVNTNSLVVRCTPLEPISLKKTTKTREPIRALEGVDDGDGGDWGSD